ncbi:MAG: hypothetical protein GY855_11175 [candidate division Zixibacteria bacterium]|nr:hypothetical protein [candidate division Zixibacteria bacterium]
MIKPIRESNMDSVISKINEIVGQLNVREEKEDLLKRQMQAQIDARKAIEANGA